MGNEKAGGIIALIGAILTLVSTFLPVAQINWNFFGVRLDVYYWIWGFYYARSSGWGETVTETGFDLEIYGVICGSIIVLAAIIAMVKSNSARKGDGGGAVLLIMGILAIIAMVSWIILIDIIYAEEYSLFGENVRISFWSFFEFSYGIYLLFGGAILLIVGAIIVMTS